MKSSKLNNYLAETQPDRCATKLWYAFTYLLVYFLRKHPAPSTPKKNVVSPMEGSQFLHALSKVPI